MEDYIAESMIVSCIVFILCLNADFHYEISAARYLNNYIHIVSVIFYNLRSDSLPF